jgi:putative protease
MQEHAPLSEHAVGVVTHYWSHLGVAGVHLTEPVDVGDHIHVFGHTTDFEQDVGSMQIDHHDITHAGAGQDVGIRVAEHAREHDTVYKLAREDAGVEQHWL